MSAYKAIDLRYGLVYWSDPPVVHATGKADLPKALCKDYNYRKCTRGEACKFVHACGKCAQPHPHSECPIKIPTIAQKYAAKAAAVRSTKEEYLRTMIRHVLDKVDQAASRGRREVRFKLDYNEDEDNWDRALRSLLREPPYGFNVSPIYIAETTQSDDKYMYIEVGF